MLKGVRYIENKQKRGTMSQAEENNREKWKDKETEREREGGIRRREGREGKSGEKRERVEREGEKRMREKKGEGGQ